MTKEVEIPEKPTGVAFLSDPDKSGTREWFNLDTAKVMGQALYTEELPEVIRDIRCPKCKGFAYVIRKEKKVTRFERMWLTKKGSWILETLSGLEGQHPVTDPVFTFVYEFDAHKWFYRNDKVPPRELCDERHER